MSPEFENWVSKVIEMKWKVALIIKHKTLKSYGSLPKANSDLCHISNLMFKSFTIFTKWYISDVSYNSENA